ncbi:hypothetical protein EDD21DRAFT_354192 [Dissophora ornata]|nr:hypothetical protein EDD21DRAFT_354192 [Dissophora ornata]
MRRKGFSPKMRGVLGKGIVLLALASSFVPSTLVQSAPAAISTTEHDKPAENLPASENIIRSIGFRICSPYSPSSSSEYGNDSAITLSSLGVLYDGESNTISLRAEGSTENEFDATTAHILLTAYDRVFYDQKIELAKVAPLIPHFKGRFSFHETFPAPTLLPEQLPRQLFSLPAVEALASIQLYNAQGNPILCTSVPLTNTVSAQSPAITIASVSLTAAAIALTAISSILASLTSAAVLTTMPLAAAAGGGTGSGANPSSGLSPSVWDIVSFCQFISMSGSLNLEYPELLQQWTQNFAWSMGLVPSESWSTAIDGLRSRTSKNESVNPDQESLSKEILYNGNIGSSNATNSTTTTGPESNKTVTLLSMQSIVDGATKAMVGKAALNSSKPQTIDTSKIDASRLMSSTAAFKSESRQLSRRQVSSAGTPTPTSTPTPVHSGAGTLPSMTNSSLMNRFGDISNLKSTASVQPSLSTLVPQPTPSVSWPQSVYHPSTNQLTEPGLASFGQRLNIPAKNMFMTSLFLFLILLLATSLLALVLRIALEGYAYIRPGKFTKLRRRFSSYYLGNMLRVILLAYFAVATMAFYQLTLQDCWAITLLAVMTLLLFLALVTYITLRLRRAGGTSLFFDERLKSKYGALYDQYVLSAYWFFVPVLIYQILKAAIVGLGYGGNGAGLDRHGTSDSWAQTCLLLLVEVCFAALLIWKHPFANKTPNRLNGVLGCVRVFNVVMLAVLIEGATVSTVSRTVVGVIIAGTQALMMVVLACLVFYQLGRALWRLWLVVKARKEAKERKKKNNANPLDREEVLVISVKDHEKHERDHHDDDNDPQGRMASERSRVGGESMTSLVGMMGIGSNPTIRCTPASDDEDDGFGTEDEDFEKDVIPGRYSSQGNQNSVPAQNKDEEVLRGSSRDSAQSIDSHSSFILDYYNPSYLPASIQSKILKEQQAREEALEQRENGFEEIDDNLEDGPAHTALAVPLADPEEPWVQSAYMTRRRSESNAHLGDQQGNRTMNVHTINRHASFPLQQQARQVDIECELQQQQQRRRRPLSMGASRQDLEPMTFSLPGTRSRQHNSRIARVSRLEPLPTFRATYIPDSLLSGPPSPSLTEPRRSSFSSAILVTPLSMSPVLGIHQEDSSDAVSPNSLTSLTEARESSFTAPIASVSAATPNFEEYRFPDERLSHRSSGGVYGAIHRTVAAGQRNIHPLSPSHPDYQHPDDLYNANLASPNEEGPASAPVASSPPHMHSNVPNAIQGGKNSRRESQSTHDHTVVTSDASSIAPLGASSTAVGNSKRSAPGLRIITNPRAMVPPPQIPIPSLPMTPFSASVTADAMIALQASSLSIVTSAKTTTVAPTTQVDIASNSKGLPQELHLQLTPTSSIISGASQENAVNALEQEPNSRRAKISAKLFERGRVFIGGITTTDWTLFVQ